MATFPRSVLITGANRGLGLEFVRQMLEMNDAPSVLFATCRNPDEAQDLKKLQSSAENTKILIVKFYVCCPQDLINLYNTVAKETGTNGLNLLINNAGMYEKGHSSLDEQTPESLMEHFKANCVAPVMITKTFIPLLKSAAAKNPNQNPSIGRAAVIMISTKMASVAENTSGGSYQYRLSKAALNMASKSLALDLAKEHILVMPLHPGWVRTRMGGPQGLIDEKESIAGMLKVMRQLTEADVGQFYDYKGEKIPW